MPTEPRPPILTAALAAVAFTALVLAFALVRHANTTPVPPAAATTEDC